MQMQTPELSIRAAGPSDRAAVSRLAALDDAPAVPAAALVAEVDGHVVAALPLESGRPIADPFEPTADLVALLRLRARQLGSAA
jgi:hypothetical protein